VAENLGTVGLPHALSGPIRRGDRAAVEGHWRRLRAGAPEAAAAYRSLAALQIRLARQLGDATTSDLEQIRRILGLGRR
jgi:predicted short-subunit dehydrogenase-like oxidoreductase (DUF2520 family)